MGALSGTSHQIDGWNPTHKNCDEWGMVHMTLRHANMTLLQVEAYPPADPISVSTSRRAPEAYRKKTSQAEKIRADRVCVCVRCVYMYIYIY